MKRVFWTVFLFLFLMQVAYADSLSACKTSGWISGTTYTLTQDVSASGTCMGISNADNLVLDCSGHSISGTTRGIDVNLTNNILIKNCIVKSSIFLYNSANLTFSNNQFTSNINMHSLKRSLLVNNLGNGSRGLDFNGININDTMLNNTLLNDNPTQNSIGESGGFNSGLKIVNNTFISSGVLSFYSNVLMTGNVITSGRSISIIDYGDGQFGTQTIGTSNLVDGKIFYWLYNISGQTYDASSNIAQFTCINCNNIVVKNSALSIANSGCGILLKNTVNSKIQNDNVTGSGNGICTSSCNNIEISGSQASIVSIKTTNSSRFFNNTVGGVDLTTSNNNDVDNNTLVAVDQGISLSSSNGNIIENNYLANLEVAAIHLDASSNNIIKNNDMSNNNFIRDYEITYDDEDPPNEIDIPIYGSPIDIASYSGSQVAVNNTFDGNIFANLLGDTIYYESNVVPVITAKSQGQNSVSFGEVCTNCANLPDVQSSVYLADSLVSVDTAAEPSLNVSSTVTLSLGSKTCPATVYYYNHATTNLNTVLSSGQICNAGTTPACTNIQCSGSKVTFNVPHFDSYGANGTESGSDNSTVPEFSPFTILIVAITAITAVFLSRKNN